MLLPGRGGKSGVEGVYTRFNITQLFSSVPHMPNSKKLENPANLSPQSPALQNGNKQPPLLMLEGKRRKIYDDDNRIIY